MPHARDNGRGAVADLQAPPQTRHAIENAEVSRIFRELADFLELEDANPFRIRAYRNAARVVEELPESVDAMARKGPDRLSELPGIGKDLAGKICEICRTGNLAAQAEAQHEAPQGALELMRVPGLGPRKAMKLCEELRVRSLADLAKAARRGRIHKVRGFGHAAAGATVKVAARRAEIVARKLRDSS